MADEENFEVVGHQTLAVAASAVGLTLVGANVHKAEIKIRDAEIRWRADGTDPTASVGRPEATGSVFEITGSQDLADFKAIRVTSTSAEINIIYLAKVP
jgi:hypothetical protein